MSTLATPFMLEIMRLIQAGEDLPKGAGAKASVKALRTRGWACVDTCGEGYLTEAGVEVLARHQRKAKGLDKVTNNWARRLNQAAGAAGQVKISAPPCPGCVHWQPTVTPLVHHFVEVVLCHADDMHRDFSCFSPKVKS